MGMSQQHNPMEQDEALPTRGRVSTKGSCADDDEDEDEEELQTDISYLCKMLAGDPPQLVAIERVVVEKVRHADVTVPKPTSEVRFVG